MSWLRFVRALFLALHPYPFDPKLSYGLQRLRRRHLRSLFRRATDDLICFVKLRISFLITQMTSHHLHAESFPLQDLFFCEFIVGYLVSYYESAVFDQRLLMISSFFNGIRESVHLISTSLSSSASFFFPTFKKPFENVLRQISLIISSFSVYFHRPFDTDICWDLWFQFKDPKVPLIKKGVFRFWCKILTIISESVAV